YGFPRIVTSAGGGYELSAAVPQVPTAIMFNPFFMWGGDALSVSWGDSTSFHLPVYAEVRWARFNPRTPARTYYLAQRYARQQMVGGGADAGVGLYWANFALDAAML